MLNQQSSLSEITDSIRHINEVFLPNVKQKLAHKTHYDAGNTFDVLIDNIALDKLGGKRWSSGVGYLLSYYLSFSTASNTGAGNFYPLQVSGIGFIPSTIVIYNNKGNFVTAINTIRSTSNKVVSFYSTGTNFGLLDNAYINETGFQLPVARNTDTTPFYWYASE